MTALLLATIGATLFKGWRWVFTYFFVPAVLLVPCELYLVLQGIPNLTPQRAVVIGILLGCLGSRRERELFPRWRSLDAWVLALLLSYSVSFGLHTDFMGFVHKLAVQVLDWGLPYLYARRMFVEPGRLRRILAVMAFCGVVLACTALYEARMADRLTARWWNLVADYPVPDFWRNGGGLRYGFLRAFGPFGHPLILATVLVALAPLALCWGYLDAKRRTWARVASLVTSLGILGPIARGAVLVLSGVAGLTYMVVKRLPVVFLGLCAALLGFLLLSDTALQVFETTRTDLELEGNTESGKYRLALLLIYLKEIPKVGFFGDPTVIGSTYQAAWSIDNGYLYMYLTGGWIGGTGFLLLVIATCRTGYRSLRRSSGLERRVRACIAASFLGMSLSIANVWFARDMHALFFVLVALVWSQSAPGWYRSLYQGSDSSQGKPQMIEPVRGALPTSS